MSPHVVAAIATFRRPKELARLLASVPGSGKSFGLAIVVDNSADQEVERICMECPCATHYIPAPTNLGCGGGLRLAEETAWSIAGDRLTHILILDDDAVLSQGSLDALVEAMEKSGSAAAVPTVIDKSGNVGWLPGFIGMPSREYHQLPTDPAALRAYCLTTPLYFSWAPGICLMIQRTALEQHGFHRDDFWIRGEDLDFSLRMTSTAPGLFVPDVVVQHLPPFSASASGRNSEYLQHCAMLQNVAFLGLALPHGRRIRRTIPGNSLRLIRTWGIGAIPDIARALWRGAVLGQPAGKGHGNTFLARFQSSLD